MSKINMIVGRRVQFCSKAASLLRASGCGCLRRYSVDQEQPSVNNLVGPPDPKSNIRRILYAKKKNETLKEVECRQSQQDLNRWHQEFWTKHNENFNQSKKAFMAHKGEEIKRNSNKQLADDMSVFYKDFLDQNFQLHLKYQKEWYLRNFAIVWLAFQVSIKRLVTRVFQWKGK